MKGRQKNTLCATIVNSEFKTLALQTQERLRF